MGWKESKAVKEKRPEHPSGWGKLVKGRCPACGYSSLFLGEGGYITCAILSCTDPTAASDLLEYI